MITLLNLGKYENLGLAILLVVILLILALSFNIKFVKKDHVLIVEKMGRFSRIISKKGLCILIPFVEREYKQVSIKETSHEIILHITKNLDGKVMLLKAVFDYKISNPELFVYSSLTPITNFNLIVLSLFEEITEKKVVYPISEDVLTRLYNCVIENANLIGIEINNFELKHEENILK